MHPGAQSLLIGHPRQKRRQEASLFRVQCTQERVLVLPRDAADGLKDLPALCGQLQHVDATVARVFQPLDQSPSCSSSTSATSRLGNMPSRSAISCWLDPAEAAMTRREPTCAGVNPSGPSRSANFAAAWAPTCARRNAGDASFVRRCFR